MNKFLFDIQNFHEKFNKTYNGPPRSLTGSLAEFRARFQEEELGELLDAWHDDDLNKGLDALVDALYVLLGTVYLCGLFPIFEQAWDQVHDKNMQKELASAKNPSKRGHNAHDIVKPPGWTPPDHTRLIEDLIDSFPPGELKPPMEFE